MNFLRFCPKCDNCMTIKLQPTLFFRCESCDIDEIIPPQEYHLFCVKLVVDEVPPTEVFFNEFSIYDKSLPRKRMHCNGCDQTTLVITILADRAKLRYVHCCEECQRKW